jgi:uncharacterized protein
MSAATLRKACLACIALAAIQGAAAAGQDDPRASNDFLTYHPDMASRKTGMDAYHRGNYVVAADYFRRAARYADKASEAALAEMYWQGQGVPKDHALAYAWMDLAAERHYPSLLAIRERYWQQLSPAEQARAVEAGQAVYAEYGDDVAKPRLAVQLRLGLDAATGSRIGFVGTMENFGQTPSTGNTKNKTLKLGGQASGDDGNQYYASRYWNEKDYYAWQDSVWDVPPRHGTVDVGALESVHDDMKPARGQQQSNPDSQHD